MSRRFHDLVELGEESCRTFGDLPLFGTRRATGWEWITYREFQGMVDAFRGGLASLGVGAGDRVAIVSRNRVEWAVAAYATYGLGATFVPMYEAQRSEEWAFILADAGAKVVIGSTQPVVTALLELKPRIRGLAHVVGIDHTPEGAASYDALISRGRAEPVPSTHPAGDAVAGFIYTSGTTGKPKGVMLTHDNLTSNVAAGTSVFPMSSDDRTVSFLPWAHVYGQVVELHVLVSVGASTAFNTDTTKLVEEIGDVRPTMLVAVPRIWNRIYGGVSRQMEGEPGFVRALFKNGIAAAKRRRRGEHLGPLESVGLALADRVLFARVRKKLGGRLKYALSASAALSLEVAEFVDALGIDVYEGYGLSETSPIVSANTPDARKLGSVGRPIPGVTVVIDTAVGDEPGRGEILVYGPNVMKGYHARPEENAAALMPDGGFRTGDIGYLDDDGFLWVTGRIKEQYKLENGKYVMPAPLEEVLGLSPYFTSVMLYGDGKPYNVAVVVLAEASVRAWAAANHVELEADVTEDPRVRALAAAEIERLSESFRGYEKPRGFILTKEDFTIEGGLLTPTLKLKRRVALEKYKARLDALYGPRVEPVEEPPSSAPGARRSVL